MFGYLFDPDDDRDRIHAWGTAYQPHLLIEPEVDLWLPGQEIVGQGSTNACTGYAGAYAARIAIANQTGTDPGRMSARFLYYIGRAVWGGEDKDDGSYIRTMFEAMQIQGTCVEKVFIDNHKVLTKPTWRAVKNAFKHRGVKSYRHIYTVDEAMTALSMGVPLVGGWYVGDDFRAWGSGDDPLDVERTVRGAHAMCVCGYDEDGNFKLANSGGTGFGDRGFITVSPKFLLSSNRLWACDTRD